MFTVRSHWTLWSRHTCSYIDDTRTTVVRHSRENLTTVVRHSCVHLTTVVRHSHKCLTTVVLFMSQSIAYLSHGADRGNYDDSRETFVRASHDSRETFARMYHDCAGVSRQSWDIRASVLRRSCEFYFLAIQSRNCLNYVTDYRICIAYLSHGADRGHCDVYANVCEGLATGSRHMRWLGYCFAMIFVAQKSITCDTFWRTVRDQIKMHARTLWSHANVWRWLRN